MKKIILYSISFIIVISTSVVLFEAFFKIIPIAYKSIKKSDSNSYVYILGESSSYGTPYSEKISFAKLIKCKLNNRIDNKKIKLIIFAYPGSRLIHQYFKYLYYKYTHPFHKGIVLLYIGTNNWAVAPTTNVNKSLLLKFNIKKLLDYYCKYQYDFKSDYENIILLAKKFGDDIYISTISGNYSGFMPNNAAPLLNADFLYEIDNLILSKKYQDALDKCNRILKQHDDQSQILYRIGKIFEKQNKIKEAKKVYLNAIEYNYDTRPTRYQNNVIKKLAAKYNIPVTDIFEKLNNSDEIVGYNFFVDNIHPNIKLHELIAEGFIELLSKKYQLSINKNLTEEVILKMVEFNEQDLFALHRDILGSIILHSYNNGILNRFNLEIIKQHMVILKNMVHDNEQKRTLLFFDALWQYINGNKEETLKIIINNDLIRYFDDVKIAYWNFYFKNWFINLIKTK